MGARVNVATDAPSNYTPTGNRFVFTQQHDGYVDYDTELGSLEGKEAEQIKDENVRRLTFVLDERKAYLTMRDFSEGFVSWDEALLMLSLD